MIIEIIQWVLMVMGGISSVVILSMLIDSVFTLSKGEKKYIKEFKDIEDIFNEVSNYYGISVTNSKSLENPKGYDLYWNYRDYINDRIIYLKFNDNDNVCRYGGYDDKFKNGLDVIISKWVEEKKKDKR